MAESECEVCGELSYRSGERRHFAVRSQNSIKGILGGVRRLQEQVSGALSELVLEEKRMQAPCGGRPSSSSGEDEEDNEDEPVNKGGGDAPPAKRTRKQS
ncbi:uncharacterized protein si:dkeyp-55f12.3 [Heptranchias perlo]|uniref:uncharacterized protein si:dkeyp-55f12.3 n=1 Tax=Heptranchias perlo TaxID=212740 RepID=UPI0035593A40